MLHRATEVVTSVAQKLLVKRFERTLSDVNTTALLVCPVCRTDILFLAPSTVAWHMGRAGCLNA